jgi:hypothetical protein
MRKLPRISDKVGAIFNTMTAVSAAACGWHYAAIPFAGFAVRCFIEAVRAAQTAT